MLLIYLQSKKKDKKPHLEQEKELISFSLPFHILKPDIKTKDVSIAYRSCMKAHRCLPCNSDYFVQPHTVENRGISYTTPST